MQNLKSSSQKSGKALVGIILLGVGCILLLRTLDIFYIPGWVLSWPVLMIVIGCFIGSRQGFDHPSAFVPLIIGVIFLSNRILPDMDLSRFFWPLLVIGFGVWMIMGRKTPKINNLSWNKKSREESYSVSNTETDTAGAGPGDPLNPDLAASAPYPEDLIESVSIFGGVKKNIVSKNFRGGEIINFFGGSEINLMQADINGRINLEVVQVFGGTKIIVPANWTVHSEMVAIFGGIEDKRPPQLNVAAEKVLVIQGTSIFGGIDIKSY
ncbi:LiaF transmembrane domain-containing protein [Daejeonella sp.]|uniref:LiaF transmembrane domain-containing protein n=1 Tax=Daejeonella sp. TaxID=2805397 RepID=UPI0039831412